MERLSGLDAGFLYMETPTLLMHTLKVAVLDEPPGGALPSVEDLRAEVAERLPLLPPFRRRLVEVPLRFHHPVWIEDPDLDLEYHVRRIVVPPPGTRGELDAVIATIAGWPLDRRRPLWEMYVMDGLRDGAVAVLIKIHHAAADGVAATQLLANAMTTDPEVLGPALESDDWRPDPLPSSRRLLWDAFVDHFRQLGHLPRLLGRTLRNLFSLVRHNRGRHVQTPRPLVDTPNTPFNGSLTSHRSFATGTLALTDAKEVRAAFGVTVNDVVLSVVGGALRTYLLELDALPEQPLVAGVPVSTDRPDAVRRLGGNRVSNLFASLATDVEDPAERLAVIHDVTGEAKVVHNLLGATMMQEWQQYAPPGPYSWFMRQYSGRDLADRHRSPINLVVSNVPGPREPLYTAGSRLRDIYSVGPVLEGIGLNITLWSYLDRLEVGVLADREAVPEPSRIVDLLHRSMDEHVHAARLASTTTPS